VPDAFAFAVAPPREEDLVLAAYRFVPWVKSGVGASVTRPFSTSLTARGEVAVSVPILDEENAPAKDEQGAVVPPAEVRLRVLGPGDVVGIDPRQVIRTFPADGSTTADPGRFCHVELDRPDFPWLFTPAAAVDDRLPPWLSLVCVEALYATLAGGRPLPTLTAPAAELPPLTSSWAWAHAQIVGSDGAGPSLADRLSAAYAALNLARITCPRRLKPRTAYVAALVPTFAAGRLVGLGRPLPPNQTLAWAWDGTEDPVTLPVYYSFRFSTGERGDFEDLAERLQPRVAPWQVGRRPMDASQPGAGLSPRGADEPGAVVLMGGALQAIAKPRDELDIAWPAPAVAELTALANTPDDLAQTAAATVDNELLTVAPPLYGRWHAAERRIAAGSAPWLAELNLDIRHRVVAGLGTRVIQAMQERLIAEAWRQVGELEKTNQQLRQAQLARFAGEALHRRMGSLSADRLLRLTAPVHSRLRSDASLTVAGRLDGTSLPRAALGASLRRLTRPEGPVGQLARRQGAVMALSRLAVRPDGLTRSYVRRYRNPDGIDAIADVSVDLATSRTGVSAVAIRADVASAVRAPAIHEVLSPQALATAPLAASYDTTLVALTVNAELAPAVVASTPGPTPGGGVGVAPMRPVGVLRPRAAGEAIELNTTRLAELLDVSPGSLAGVESGLRRRAHAVLKDALPAFEDRQLSGAQVRELFTMVGSNLIGAIPRPSAPAVSRLAVGSLDLLARLDPRKTVTARIKGRAGTLPPWLAPTWFDDGLIEPVMAAPTFPRAMYADLRDLGQEYLVAGIDRLPADTVTLLQTNPEFVEAFLIGLNHEMARELLWRGFPTDQRGTYFKWFWSPAHEDLDAPLHRLAPSALGRHVVGEDPANPRVVLLVRGELLRRYPGTHVYAVKELLPPTDRRRLAADHVDPVVQGTLAPDASFAIFPLVASDLSADPAWRFVLAENVTEPSFGFDAVDRAGRGAGRLGKTGAPISPDDIAWPHVPVTPDGQFVDAGNADFPPIASPSGGAAQPLWGRDAAAMAHIAFQRPARVVFNAGAMILQVPA
jgi:hypothetical protein